MKVVDDLLEDGMDYKKAVKIASISTCWKITLMK